MGDYLLQISELAKENKRLKNIIIEAKICCAALCIAEMPSLKGFREIASILNQGIDEDDVKKALFENQTNICPICLEEKSVNDLHRNCGK